MSSEETPATDAPARRLPLPAIMLAVGLVAGGAAGFLVAGPMVVKRAFPGGVPTAMAAQPADAAHDEEPPADASSDSGEQANASVPAVPPHMIENLIVNPAGTQGTRFLLLSLAIEAKDGVAVDAIKARDAEVRDAVIDLVGAQSVDVLSDVAQREPLKKAVTERVAALFPKGTIRKLYFPQFVIQ